MESILLSPYLTLTLSFLVLYRWVIRSVYEFQWQYLGAIFSRFIFCVLYAIIITYEPPGEALRIYVRVGLNVLFFDELFYWGSGAISSTFSELAKKIKEKLWGQQKKQ